MRENKKYILASLLSRMKSRAKYSCLITLFCFGLNQIVAQDRNMDSLKALLKNELSDTVRCNILSALTESAGDDEWPLFNTQLKELAEKKMNEAAATSNLFKVYAKHFANALNNVGYLAAQDGENRTALEIYHQSLKIQEQIGDKLGMLTSCTNLGNSYVAIGQISRAMENYQRSLKIGKDLGDKNNIAQTLNNIGFVFYKQGDIPKALDHYTKSLKMKEALGDKVGVAVQLNNIGQIYSNQGDFSKALEYYFRVLKIYEETLNKRGVSIALNNIGAVFDNQGDFPKALVHYYKSLKIREELGDRQGMAYTLNNIGIIHKKSANNLVANLQKALEYFDKSKKLLTEIGDKSGLAYLLNNTGDVYFNFAMLPGAPGSKEQNLKAALTDCSESLRIGRELGSPENIRNAAERLHKIYKALASSKRSSRVNENYKNSFEYYHLFIQMRDSINNESTRKASIKSQLKYEYEKQAAADSVAHAKENEIKSAELSRQSAEIRAKKNQQYALFGGLGLLMIFAGFMFNRFKVTQKQKGIIEEQKKVVEEQKNLVEVKQKEVMDSIRYAQRIQRAQLPSEKKIIKSLQRLRKP